MTQNSTFHTHTIFSDGENTVEEMISCAKNLGFETIGISDHLTVHKNIKQSPAYNNIKNLAHQTFEEMIEPCKRHAEEIHNTGKKLKIKTMVGYEVDFFTYSGWKEELENFLKQIDYDYLISGNHFFMSENGEDIYDIWRFEEPKNQAPEDITVYLKRHFKTMRQAIETNLFSFLAHIDYAQKTPSYKQSDYQKEIDEILKALKETDTGCEISTKGIRKLGHFYPSESILKKLIEQNTPIIISDDAHATDQIGTYFDLAEETLQKLNCKKRLKL